MMIRFFDIVENELSTKNYEAGNLYFCYDTLNIYYDSISEGKRIHINGTITVLETETDRTNILAPIPYKLYFVKDSNKTYIYCDSSWMEINPPRESDILVVTADIDNNVASHSYSEIKAAYDIGKPIVLYVEDKILNFSGITSDKADFCHTYFSADRYIERYYNIYEDKSIKILNFFKQFVPNPSEDTDGKYLKSTSYSVEWKDLDVISEEEIPNLYVWKKYDADPKNVKETDVSSAQISWRLENYSTAFSIKNSDSISTDGGSISLVDETTSLITADNTDDILGKFIYSSGSVLTGDSDEGYYFIPTNATFTVNTTTLFARNIKKLSMPTCLGYVSTKSFNAYTSGEQHTDGYWYQYIKQLGDSAIVDGSSVNFTETDPTVPAWAKAATKPTYTASEVGALPNTTNYAGSSSAGGAATSANKLNTNAGSETQPVYFNNGVPVATTHTLEASVPSDAKFTDTIYVHPFYFPAKDNGFYKVTVDNTGHVSEAIAVSKNDITALGLTASDIGALPNTTVIPSKTSDLTNDSGYITSVPVTSVNGMTGDVTIEIETDTVKYVEQTLTDEQKQQAQDNIGFSEADAISLVTEMGLVSPTVAEDGSIYTDENGALYSL